MFSCPLNRPEEERTGHQSSAKAMLCRWCTLLYAKGGLSGAGGGVSLREESTVYLAPAVFRGGVRCPTEAYLFSAGGRMRALNELEPTYAEHRSVMMLPYVFRQAGAVVHSHSVNAVLASKAVGEEVTIRHAEAAGLLWGFHVDMLPIPVIENSDTEKALEASFLLALKAHPHAPAVLVRGHGIFLWGRDWTQAEIRMEIYENLFHTIATSRRRQAPAEQKGALP